MKDEESKEGVKMQSLPGVKMSQSLAKFIEADNKAYEEEKKS